LNRSFTAEWSALIRATASFALRGLREAVARVPEVRSAVFFFPDLDAFFAVFLAVFFAPAFTLRAVFFAVVAVFLAVFFASALTLRTAFFVVADAFFAVFLGVDVFAVRRRVLDVDAMRSLPVGCDRRRLPYPVSPVPETLSNLGGSPRVTPRVREACR
jgi:hypothetical protein